MLKDFLLQYLRYNQWANLRMINFIKENCSEEQVQKEIRSSFPSLRETLLHIWGAESIWLDRLNEENSPVWKAANYSGTFLELCNNILQSDDDLIAFVDACGEQFLNSPFVYRNMEGKEFRNTRSDTIMHCVNHSTFHRGQIITLLRQLEFTKLFSTDYIAYCREKAN